MPEIPEKTDVLVVGAGPAGSTVARIVASAGWSVLLVDRARSIGQPVRCAEYVRRDVLRGLSVSLSAVAAEVHTCRVHWEQGVESFPAAGYLLRREVYDSELAVAAARAGSTVLSGARFLSSERESSQATIRFGEGERGVRYSVLVGADGPRSTVRKLLGLPPARLIRARQFEILLLHDQVSIDFFFRHRFKGGYGWVFAKGKTANVGIGSNDPVTRELLEDFLTRDVAPHFPYGGCLRSIAAPIPCYDPTLPLVAGNALLVGDAAGQVDCITGGGLGPGRLGAHAAGRAIVEALQRKDIGALDGYPSMFRQRCGAWLNSAFEARRELDAKWDEYESILRKVWFTYAPRGRLAAGENGELSA